MELPTPSDSNKAGKEEERGQGCETRLPIPDLEPVDPRLPPYEGHPAPLIPDLPPPPYSVQPTSSSASSSSIREPGDGQERERERASGLPSNFLPSSGSPDKDAGDSAAAAVSPSDSVTKSKRWTPNAELVERITNLGFSPVAAEKALFYTNNVSADTAVGWILDNPTAAEDPRPLDLEGFSSADSDSEGEEPTLGRGAAASGGIAGPAASSEIMIGGATKMVLVVNSSLKMGLGKIAAQVGHGTLGIYRQVLGSAEGADALAIWDAQGETKVVVKGDSSEQLLDIEKKAREIRVPSYLVQDAGRTQIAAGSMTVLALFGPNEKVDTLTGKLKLL